MWTAPYITNLTVPRRTAAAAAAEVPAAAAADAAPLARAARAIVGAPHILQVRGLTTRTAVANYFTPLMQELWYTISLVSSPKS